MLYYDRIDVSQRIGVNKTSESKESDICHYWYFLHEGFTFQSYVCNRCHDLVLMSINFSNIAILNIKGSDYHCITNKISKSEATNLTQNVNFTKKKQNIIKHKKLLS